MWIRVSVQHQDACSVAVQRLHSSEGFRYYVSVHDRIRWSDLDSNGKLFYAKGNGRFQNDDQQRGEDRRRTWPGLICPAIVPLIQEGVIVRSGVDGNVQMNGHRHHPKKYGYLVQWHCDCFFWESQMTGHRHFPTKYGHLVQLHCNFLFWGFQMTDHHHNPTKSGPLVQWDCNFFSGHFKQMVIFINRMCLCS